MPGGAVALWLPRRGPAAGDALGAHDATIAHPSPLPTATATATAETPAAPTPTPSPGVTWAVYALPGGVAVEYPAHWALEEATNPLTGEPEAAWFRLISDQLPAPSVGLEVHNRALATAGNLFIPPRLQPPNHGGTVVSVRRP